MRQTPTEGRPAHWIHAVKSKWGNRSIDAQKQLRRSGCWETICQYNIPRQRYDWLSTFHISATECWTQTLHQGLDVSSADFPRSASLPGYNAEKRTSFQQDIEFLSEIHRWYWAYPQLVWQSPVSFFCFLTGLECCLAVIEFRSSDDSGVCGNKIVASTCNTSDLLAVIQPLLLEIGEWGQRTKDHSPHSALHSPKP